MAIALEDKQNVEAPSAAYPQGRIKDNPGDGTGTPVNVPVYGDFHQFFARLLVEAGITPNGVPDNAYDGFQYIDALSKLFVRNDPSVKFKYKKLLTGAWDADGVVTRSIAHGLDVEKIRGLSAIMMNDVGSSYSNIASPQAADNGLVNGGISLSGSSNVILYRTTGGDFDSASYSSTFVNRAVITILYEI